jgi:hypothetical protein
MSTVINWEDDPEGSLFVEGGDTLTLSDTAYLVFEPAAEGLRVVIPDGTSSSVLPWDVLPDVAAGLVHMAFQRAKKER